MVIQKLFDIFDISYDQTTLYVCMQKFENRYLDFILAYVIT